MTQIRNSLCCASAGVPVTTNAPRETTFRAGKCAKTASASANGWRPVGVPTANSADDQRQRELSTKHVMWFDFDLFAMNSSNGFTRRKE